METFRPSDLPRAEREFGVVLPGVTRFSTPEMGMDHRLAMDATQVPMVTQPNAAIPAWFTTTVDPEVIRVAVAPMRATEILQTEERRGDWTQAIIQFAIIEQVGEANAYGDFNNAGVSDVNFNWVPRQNFIYQTFTIWGEREMAMAGLAGINLKNEKDLASISVLNRFQNLSYFNGVGGMLNYGLLNAPGLPAPITPSTKAAGGTTWPNATANEIFDDVKKLVIQLITQTYGLIDSNSSMTLALSPEREGSLANTNSFGLSAMALIKATYKNMRIVSAPQYNTLGGQLVQLFASDLAGQNVGFTAFSEKLRAHAIVVEPSAWKQKKSQGTWGAIIKQPLAVAQMLGI